MELITTRIKGNLLSKYTLIPPRNGIIYLVKNHENCLAEEERVFKEHAATIPGIKVTDVYLEETPEEREHLITKLYEKAKKGEVQIILTNSFAFAFCVE